MSFKLTETVILSLMKEEYDNRIFNYLFELQDSYAGVVDGKESNIDVLSGALEAKVKHKETGYIFTIKHVDDDKVVLNLPDEPRIKKSEDSKSLVYEVDGDEYFFNTSGSLSIDDEEDVSDNIDMLDSKKKEDIKQDKNNCLIIGREEFKKEFSLE